MDSTQRKSLEAAGWQDGDAADFPEMNEAERQRLEARVEIAPARPRAANCPLPAADK